MPRLEQGVQVKLEKIPPKNSRQYSHYSVSLCPSNRAFVGFVGLRCSLPGLEMTVREHTPDDPSPPLEHCDARHALWHLNHCGLFQGCFVLQRISFHHAVSSILRLHTLFLFSLPFSRFPPFCCRFDFCFLNISLH